MTTEPYFRIAITFAEVYAIVDIEATGGKPNEGRITEIAIIHHDGEKVTDEYSTLVNPERSIDSFVVQLTGITNEMVQSAPTFSKVANEILKRTEGRIFVAHNVRFDYSFLKTEFKRVGKRFQRQNLCTVELSKKLLPGHRSYSLGRLCKDLNIQINGRHRALGDAKATTILLEKLIETDHLKTSTTLAKEFDHFKLPPLIEVSQLDNLPEEVGILYFFNDKQEIIYLTKAKNIRHKAIKLLRDKHSSFTDIAEVDYKLTGSHLLAQLIEESELQDFEPEYNLAIRRRHSKYGVYLKEDIFGFLELRMEPIHDQEPILEFTRKKMALEAIDSIRREYKLYQERQQKMGVDAYNEFIQEAVQRYHFDYKNFVIFGKGRDLDEQSVVFVQDGKYAGYGFVDMFTQIEDVLDNLQHDDYNLSKQLMISNYLRRKQKATIVEL